MPLAHTWGMALLVALAGCSYTSRYVPPEDGRARLVWMEKSPVANLPRVSSACRERMKRAELGLDDRAPPPGTTWEPYEEDEVDRVIAENDDLWGDDSGSSSGGSSAHADPGRHEAGSGGRGHRHGHRHGHWHGHRGHGGSHGGHAGSHGGHVGAHPGSHGGHVGAHPGSHGGHAGSHGGGSIGGGHSSGGHSSGGHSGGGHSGGGHSGGGGFRGFGGGDGKGMAAVAVAIVVIAYTIIPTCAIVWASIKPEDRQVGREIDFVNVYNDLDRMGDADCAGGEP